MYPMIFGIVALCQPWSRSAARYGVTISSSDWSAFRFSAKLQARRQSQGAVVSTSWPTSSCETSRSISAPTTSSGSSTWRSAHREFVVLLGPSGCGKTTTLRAIAGLEEIDTGDILIDGKPVQDLRAADRDIAFVFQLFALYPHLTAYENIAFPLRATSESRGRRWTSQVRAVAKALQIEHLLNKRPSALSGGDMQRVAIGRALVRRPKAMLMDEPIGALDAKLREDMRTELKRLHIENEPTTIYVTHDQMEAMSLADRIAIMNDGVLQQVGTPTEVYRTPRTCSSPSSSAARS